MADESTSYSDLISRRRFVELSGVTGAAALAGCGGDGDGTDTPSGNGNGNGDGTDMGTPQPTGTPVEQFYGDVEHLGSTTVKNPSQVQYNPWNSASAPQISQYLLFERFAQYYFAEGEFKPAAMKEWSLSDDGSTFTMTLRDGLTWSNGEDVTADDVVRQLKIAEYDEDPVWVWADSVEAVDDKTVEIGIGGDVNQVVIEADLFAGRTLRADEETYGQWLTDLENGDAEISELRNFADTDPVTCGPFTKSGVNDQQILTEHVSKVDGADHPDANKINFGNYTFQVAGGNQQATAALRSLSVDSNFSLSVGARTVDGFPDAVDVVNWPNVWGFSVTPNHAHKHAGDRAVRQAIAYAVNRQQCVRNSLPRSKRAPDKSVHITDVNSTQETYLGDAHDDYRSYGRNETMKSEVNSVMESAGYSKVDGTWQDSDGNTVSLPMTCPGGWGDWVDQAETVVSNLQSVGFESSFVSMSGYLSSDTPLKGGDFVLGAGPWLHGGPLSHPYFGFLHNFVTPQVASQEVKASYPTWTSEWGGNGIDTEITVPARSGSGEMTIAPGKKSREMSTITDEAEMSKAIKDIAWVGNVDLPTIPVADKIYQSWLTHDDWDIPTPPNESPHATLAYAQTWLPRQGLMNYKGDN